MAGVYSVVTLFQDDSYNMPFHKVSSFLSATIMFWMAQAVEQVPDARRCGGNLQNIPQIHQTNWFSDVQSLKS